MAVPLKDMTADTVCTAFYTNWVARFGTPKILTTDQGSQFESTLFKALTNMIGVKHIHTTPYHPASNGIIERWHRSFKAALICHSSSWLELLPTVLLGLRMCFKEDLKASTAEMIYGTTLRIPGEFFTNPDMPADPQIFIEKFREHMRQLRPTPTSHHIKPRLFILKDLYKCSHAFVRCDAVKAPLEPPYSGPYKIIKRINDYIFVLDINGKETTISTQRLKPAFIINDDQQNKDSLTKHGNKNDQHATKVESQTQQQKKTITFFLPDDNTGQGLDATRNPTLKTYQGPKYKNNTRTSSCENESDNITGKGVVVAVRSTDRGAKNRRKQNLIERNVSSDFF